MSNYSIINKLKNAKSICLIGHIDPDPDALGSMTVFKNFLRTHFKIKQVDIFADCVEVSEECLFIIKEHPINPSTNVTYDFAIAMDCASEERLGRFSSLFNNSKATIVIDHHATNNGYAQFNIIEDASSTCEIVFSIITSYKYKPSIRDRENLYAGIITDTNNFTTPSTTSRTFETASHLIPGMDFITIYENFFAKFSLKNMTMFGITLNNMQSIEENKIIISYLTENDMTEHNAEKNDLEGIINRLATIKGNHIACFIHPKRGLNYVSLRAKKGISLLPLVKKYNGGGHPGAAGFLSSLEVFELINLLKEELNNLLKNK